MVVVAGGTSATNLAVENRDADSLDVTSDTGTDATLPSASTTEAGLLSAADKTVLDNAGGLMRFGTVDPVATDGNNKDVWINTVDGTVWDKSGGAWTKEYTFPGGTVDPGDHTRYFGWKASGAIVTADFTDASTSDNRRGNAPRTHDVARQRPHMGGRAGGTGRAERNHTSTDWTRTPTRSASSTDRLAQ